MLAARTVPFARRVGPSGCVHAFEPQRFVFINLCATIALNGLTTAYPHMAAVGNRRGTTRLPALDPAKATHFAGVSVGESQEGEEVPMTTVDDLSLTSCAVLKIDAEGMDFEVLEGADTTVESCRPSVYMEAHKGPKTRSAISWLQQRNYTPYWHFSKIFDSQNFNRNPENPWGDIGDVNLLALPAERGIKARLPLINGPESDWQADYRSYLSQR